MKKPVKECILIQERLSVWREYHVDVPDGMSKEEFVEHLKQNDPFADGYENDGFEYITDTETYLEAEYRTDDYDLLGSHKEEGVE